jgi:hypothetical protein
MTKPRFTDAGEITRPSVVLSTRVVRKLPREELEYYLDARKVAHDAEDSDDELRTKLINHEAAQACPFWEEPP